MNPTFGGMRYITTITFLFVSLAMCGQKLHTDKVTKEVAAMLPGFAYRPIDSTAHTIGFYNNPGYLKSKDMVSMVYHPADTQNITHFYMSVLSTPEQPLIEVGFMAIGYTSPAVMEQEIKKLYNPNVHYLAGKKQLIVIYSDDGVYEEQEKKLLAYFKKNFKVREVVPDE